MLNNDGEEVAPPTNIWWEDKGNCNGWNKIETIYQFRCPRGGLCGKNHKNMYVKKTYDEALRAGSWHLFQKDQHPDPKFSWLEACHIAEHGIQL